MPSGVYIHKKGRTPWNKGKKGVQIVSEKTRKKMSKASKGRRWSELSKKNLSLALKSRKYKTPSGEKHPMWKGSNVGYRGIHHWINKIKGKAIICNFCSIKFYIIFRMAFRT